MPSNLGADPAFVASRSSRQGVSTKGFNPGAATLERLALRIDASPRLRSAIHSYASREQAFDDAINAAIARDDRAYHEAMARFRQMGGNDVRS